MPGDDEIRTLIRIRYGDRLTDAEVRELLPYVRSTLETSRRLEALDLGPMDPHGARPASDTARRP